MAEGVIIRSLSGFYYVADGESLYECRSRGNLRRAGVLPLVGDRVEFTVTGEGKGVVDTLLPRRNAFVRPAVANVDLLIVVAASVIPVTDPYLIDRVAALAEQADCGVVLCINKEDMDAGDALAAIYEKSGYTVLRTSAVTLEGIDALRETVRGKICAFTGNTGVGKSSLLNALSPGLGLKVGEVSEKLGRGRHTTRCVELFALPEGTYIADTPGFASFDMEQMDFIPKEELQFCFPEFRPYIGACRFRDCAHLREPGCAVRAAVEAGDIHPSRHASYERLYALSAQHKDWEDKGDGAVK